MPAVDSIGQIVGLSLLLLGGGMMWLQKATWERAERNARLAAAERDFLRRKLRRRNLVGMIIVGLGVMFVAGAYIEILAISAWWLIGYWFLAGLACLWLTLLAGADMLAAWHFYGKQRDRVQLEELKLRYQARMAEKRAQGEGDSPATDQPTIDDNGSSASSER
ncbi:MAG: hypothetical protein D6741_13155 [Planctomycetota bacterium]|nr:MAG: hypothetical protein D6741_13155 [Planctomycetota bacterium]